MFDKILTELDSTDNVLLCNVCIDEWVLYNIDVII